MADGPNLLNMTKSAINALKKPEIVKKIMELKDEVVVGQEIKSLCTHIVGQEIKSLCTHIEVLTYSKSTFT